MRASRRQYLPLSRLLAVLSVVPASPPRNSLANSTTAISSALTGMAPAPAFPLGDEAVVSLPAFLGVVRAEVVSVTIDIDEGQVAPGLSSQTAVRGREGGSFCDECGEVN